jgi:ribose transport system substrate-binding protein
VAYTSHSLRGWAPRGVVVALIAVALVACTAAPAATPTAAPTDAPTTAPTDAPTTAPTEAPTAPPTEAPSEAPEALRLVFLSFAVANSYDAPMLAEAQNAAAAEGATLTVLDANNNVETQYAQLQDVLTSGQYDGIIVQPIYGPALIPLIEEGIANGAVIGIVDQILGEDLTTNEKPLEGLAANVVFIMSEIGRKQGELTVQACTENNFDPCNVGFLWSWKITSLDSAIETAFNEVIADHPEIQIVAEGETFYTTHGGLTATETMLVARPDINVIVAADQGITGAEIAIADAGQTGDIVLIGYGGAAIAYGRIANGAQYATVAQLPASEGRYVVEDIIRALRTGEPQPSRDPVSELPHDGIVTPENVAEFTPEWPG